VPVQVASAALLLAFVAAPVLWSCSGSSGATVSRGTRGLQFEGSYNATYPVSSAVSSCTIINGSLRYSVHPPGETLPRFWVDIPYAGPWQSSYFGRFNNARMDWGDYAGLVDPTGTVTITSETAQKATGTLDIQGYLEDGNPGPVRINGAWACDIRESSAPVPFAAFGLEFGGSYGNVFATQSSVSTCTISNGTLQYSVHERVAPLPRFWLDIPYVGPSQSAYFVKPSRVGMDFGDNAEMLDPVGTVTVTSKTAQKATGTLDVQGHLQGKHAGLIRVTGDWACDIK